MSGTKLAPVATTDSVIAADTATPAEEPLKPILPEPPGSPGPPKHPRSGLPSAFWTYRDAGGALSSFVARFDSADGKVIRPYTYGEKNGKVGWYWMAPAAPRPLYGLDRLAQQPDAPVLVVEGEKTADAAQHLFPDHVAITSMGGSEAAAKTDWSPIAARSVVVWRDNDQAGAGFAQDVVRLAAAAGAARVRLVTVPDGFPLKWDVADELPDGWTREKLRELLEGAQVIDAPNNIASTTSSPNLIGLRGPRESLFENREDGLWWHYSDSSDGEIDSSNGEIWVCGPIHIVAETHAEDGNNWGVLLRWWDPNGQEHEWAMPRAMLAGDGSTYRERLLDGGLAIAPGRKARELLTEYLSTASTPERARAVSRVGWHRHSFVLGDRAIGEAGGERLLLQTTVAQNHAFRTAGELQEWQDAVALPCQGNSRLMFAISAAFAAPLLHLVGAESGGFHLRGSSSIGKSTALVVAGSVWGGGGVNGYINRWRATDNGLEALAAAHCDSLLALDELSQIDARSAGAAAYLLANGSGKARAGRGGEGRPIPEWRVVFLSSGEIGLADKIAEDGRGRRSTAGQEVRVIDIPADAGAGFGLFETLHGAAGGEAFACQLKAAAGRFYGTAAPAFLEMILGNVDAIAGMARGFIPDFVAEHCPPGADGQVTRVAGRFALVAAAGELATKLGILPWATGEAVAAAQTCFLAWLDARGGAGPTEVAHGIRQVLDFLSRHGSSRFETWGDSERTGEFATLARTINRAGWRRPNVEARWEYFATAEGFGEMTVGFDQKLVARALVERGLLLPDSAGKTSKSLNVPGYGKIRLYHLSATAVADGDANA